MTPNYTAKIIERMSRTGPKYAVEVYQKHTYSVSTGWFDLKYEVVEGKPIRHLADYDGHGFPCITRDLSSGFWGTREEAEELLSLVHTMDIQPDHYVSMGLP